MRDPATRIDDRKIDPRVEVAIEQTRHFLEPRVRCDAWKADPDRNARLLFDAHLEIQCSSLPEWVKDAVSGPVAEAMKKRSGKPTRRLRDLFLATAAARLIEKDFLLTRNDATRDSEFAGSIIQKALARLGVRMPEKTINEIVLKYTPGVQKALAVLKSLPTNPA